MDSMKVGIAGLGTIGKVIARKLAQGEVPGIELECVSVRDPVKAQDFLDGIGSRAHIYAIESLAREADLIIECAPAAAFAEIAVPVLTAGKTFMAISAGQLLERPDLVALAKEYGGQIIVPTGALLGLDAVTAAAEGEIKSVSMITRKPVKGLLGAPYLEKRGIDIAGITEPMRIFQGSAREAARGFPENVNVAAALALAGIGPDRTTIEIWADPSLSRNVHRIVVDSDSGELRDVDPEHPEREPQDGADHRAQRARGAPQIQSAASRRNVRAFYFAVADCACLPITLSKAYCAHFSPSPLETPIAPTTWPSTMIGRAPFCGKSPMNAGARFSPVRTMRLVSDVARRQRSADFAFRSAVSIPFIATPSMACNSTRLPPQSRIAIATAVRFCVAHSVQASAIARAAALVRIFWFRVTSIADDSAAKDTASTAASESRPVRMRMGVSSLIPQTTAKLAHLIPVLAIAVEQSCAQNAKHRAVLCFSGADQEAGFSHTMLIQWSLSARPKGRSLAMSSPDRRNPCRRSSQAMTASSSVFV